MWGLVRMSIRERIPSRLFALQALLEVNLLLLENARVVLGMVGNHGLCYGHSLANVAHIGGTATADLGKVRGLLDMAATVAGLFEQVAFGSVGFRHVMLSVVAGRGHISCY